ncbi:MAG: hypothetical protein EOP58_09860 [Sphingomonadales bacterium]|nr:MAG: hypothetical protein EOP58_09860 [Sphingomonadales bacterium]
MRTCYFIKGGIFLTDASRDAYFALKDRLQIAISITGERPHADLEAINPDEFKRLRDCGSALRTSTCTDLRSRKQPALNAGDRLRAWMKSFKQ